MSNRHKTFADKSINFFQSLNNIPPLPSSVSIINPYTTPEVKNIVERFFRRYYEDSDERTFIFGINPGRYGGGITGVAFTDPAALETYCGIQNSFAKIREMSSIFIYTLINRMGGTAEFFTRYYLTALFPLALIKDGRNYNYYDDPGITLRLKKYMIDSFKSQASFGSKKNAAISLGKKNGIYLNQINNEQRIFNKIIVLEHPRYIMQYKRKRLEDYLSEYQGKLSLL